MRRGRTLILVLLIIIIGLVVAFVALRQLLAPPETEQQPLYVDVWYAGQNITQGTRITADMLQTLSLPQDKVLETMFTRDEAPFLVDQIAKIDLDQGMLITEAMVTDSATSVDVEGPSWASVIPPGMTAIAIPIDRLSASGYAINNGAHVNLTACLLFVDVDPSYQTILPNLTAVLIASGLPTEGDLPVLSLNVSASGSAQGRLELDQSVQQPYYVIPSEPQRPRTVCQMLLQDVVVLRLGDFPLVEEQAAAAGDATAAGDAAAVQQDPNAAPPAPVAPDLVTLIVTPQESNTLSYLIYTNAKISLSLRNPSDHARIANEATTLQFLLSQYNIPVPAKLAYALHPALGTLVTPTLPNDAPPPEGGQ